MKWSLLAKQNNASNSEMQEIFPLYLDTQCLKLYFFEELGVALMGTDKYLSLNFQKVQRLLIR
jgi:hypothetical protein